MYKEPGIYLLHLHAHHRAFNNAQYIKRRTDEVNALRGLDWVRFKHEKQHLEEMKQKM